VANLRNVVDGAFDRNRGAVGSLGWKELFILVLQSTYLCLYKTINYEPVVLYIVFMRRRRE